MQDTAVSIGVCAHNEEETIGTLLDQILQEELPLEEVVVVAAGEDDTITVAQRTAASHDKITVIVEEERQGQTAAQNKILDEASGDLLFLVDGDGLIEPGSLETLLEEHEPETLLYGREVPHVPDTLLGSVTASLWDFHDYACQQQPKFSTQLALMPADLVEEMPEDIVLDDEYLGVTARKQGYRIRYVPEAVKHHHTRSDILFYINQRRKNWAGRMQIQESGEDPLQATSDRVVWFLRYLWAAPLKRKMALSAAAVLEVAAIGLAWMDKIRGKYPYIWYR